MNTQVCKEIEVEFKASQEAYLKELAKAESETNEDGFAQLIDIGISAVNSLYRAMQAVVKNRRDISGTIIKEKIQVVGSLQDEMMEKTKALVASKDVIVDQEKALSKMKSEQGISVVTSQSLLKN